MVCVAATDAGSTEVLAESVTSGGMGTLVAAPPRLVGGGDSAATLFSALSGLTSETATVLLGRAAGDCPEAEAVRNGTDVSVNATEALMNARGIDNRPPGAVLN
jgi:hypothetical protein